MRLSPQSFIYYISSLFFLTKARLHILLKSILRECISTFGLMEPLTFWVKQIARTKSGVGREVKEGRDWDGFQVWTMHLSLWTINFSRSEFYCIFVTIATSTVTGVEMLKSTELDRINYDCVTKHFFLLLLFIENSRIDILKYISH